MGERQQQPRQWNGTKANLVPRDAAYDGRTLPLARSLPSLPPPRRRRGRKKKDDMSGKQCMY